MNLTTDPLFILAVLCLNVVVTEWLVRHTLCRHLGTALLVIIFTAVVSNLGIIPASTARTPVYDGVFIYIAPLAIFLLLLEVNLRDILKAGLPMLSMFLLGSLGTIIGVLLAMWLVNGSSAFGSFYRPLGGMFAGTYIGGSVNFNALALQYGVVKQGLLYTGSIAVDNILTTLWMIATLALPRLLSRVLPSRAAAPPQQAIDGIEDDTATLHPLDLGLLLGLGLLGMWISNGLEALFKQAHVTFPSIIILTTLALILAQFPVVNRLKGARVLGMFLVYLFLAVIGALCNLSAYREIGTLGTSLMLLASTIIFTHGLVTFAGGALFRIDADIVAVASQANIGGSTSALALARSLGRRDLMLPSILVGSLGYAIGTYLGFAVSEFLLR